MEKIERGVAEEEFDKWAEAMRIDMDMEALDENDRNDKALNKLAVVKQIQQGNIVINEQGLLVFEPEGGGGPFTFHKPNGAVLAKSDMKKPNANDAKTNVILGSLAKTSPSNFGMPIDYADKKICIAIMTLFLV